MKDTVDGLILRESSVGESDKLLTILTAEHGKMLLRAKGVRNLKSKNLSLCLPFTYGNFEYYEKNGMRWLAGGSSQVSFFGSSYEIEDFSLAAYISDVACEITGEEANAEQILRVTLNTLYAIGKKLKPRELIKASYELFAAASSGFFPNLDGCRKCGSTQSDSYFVDVMNGNCLCHACLKESSLGSHYVELDKFESRNILIPISASALAAARYVLCAPPSRIFAFELKEDNDLADLARLAETYLLNHLERGFDTLEFYKNLPKPL